MYEYIKGILTKITAKYIVVETAGIGYLLHVANPYAYSGKMNQEVHVYLHQVVREDAHLLYGFATEEEKQLFLNLISVSGIGPVSALDLEDAPAQTKAKVAEENQALEEAMEAMLALGYKATELKKIKKFFEGTSDTAENYIKSALKMLVK